jgi:hypothetical protein
MVLKHAHQMIRVPGNSVSSPRLGTIHPLSPPGADIPSFAFAANGALDRAHRSARSRTQAKKVQRRRRTGATGHDEGNDILIRAVNSGTRAPSLSTRSWIVSMVADAQGVVLNTSRRRVSRKT